MTEKYSIKIKKENIILYNNKKNILTILGPLGKKTLKLNLKLKIIKKDKIIVVTSIPFKKFSNNNKKKIKAFQGTIYSKIKQLIIETSFKIFKKLKFIGIGYKSFNVQNFENDLFMFKLGYSHPIFFRIPKELNVNCLKLTKLFVYGNSYNKVTKTTSLIRSYKSPEPYKGKGILNENEKITLKEGKKI